MSRLVYIVCLSTAVAFGPLLGIAADDVPVHLALPAKTPLDDILATYSHLATRKVWLALGVRATVTIDARGTMSRADALAAIRTSLLERNGIELRDTESGETFVTWSNDPKYLHLTTPSTTPLGQNPNLSNPTKRRIRILQSEQSKDRSP
jgi:hypothetical protein